MQGVSVNHSGPGTCPARRVQWEERASRTSTCGKRHDAEADVGPMGGRPGQGAGPGELGRGGSWRSVCVGSPARQLRSARGWSVPVAASRVVQAAR